MKARIMGPVPRTDAVLAEIPQLPKPFSLCYLSESCLAVQRVEKRTKTGSMEQFCFAPWVHVSFQLGDMHGMTAIKF